MANSLFKPVTMKPLLGIFDNRSNVDETPPGAFRWIENFVINKDGKLSRAKGFTRAYPGPCPANHDFHFQGVGVAREPITAYFASTANNGTRRLFGMTKTRILLLNETTGDWGMIASGLGADGQASLTQLRLNAAELQNKVFFTNDFDRVKYYDLDTATFANVPTLNTAGEAGFLDVSRARRVISWNGVILLFNTLEGGTRYASRIRWSDLNDGLNYTFGAPAIADFQDLDYGHAILSAVPLGSALTVFTDRSIWRCTFTVDTLLATAALSCVKAYDEPRNRAKCLVYPNTLISNGRSAFYLGADGWYEYNPGQMFEPERLEWAHRSTKIIFDGTRAIDTAACASPVSEYRPDEDTVYLSWGKYQPITAPSTISGEIDCDTYVPTSAPAGTGLNDYIMAFNLKHKTSSLISHGSVALVNFQSDAAGTGGCNTVTKFLSSDPVDFTIKELGVGDAREYFDPVTSVYRVEGYYSILRFVFPFERLREEKEIKSFLAEIVADNALDTAVAKLRLGTSDRVVDVNGENGQCRVLWHTLSTKPIRCSHTMSPEAYVAAGIRPTEPTVQWNYLLRGRFLYADLTICAADGVAKPTTGSCAISRFEVEARLL